MPPKGHALLSASAADRWTHCPPSARLCDQREDKGSDYAAEGTEAHALGEYKLRMALGQSVTDPTDGMKWFTPEMDDATTDYANFVMEQAEGARLEGEEPTVLLEQRVDFSLWVPEGFGTADALVIANGTMQIIDLKYGKGIEVSAVDNPQLKCYGIGALAMFDGIYDIETVRLSIFQPRRDNISTFEISASELYRWADEELKPAAELAYDGKGEFQCGKWCTFCKVKHECRARAEANLELARYEFKLPPLLSDEEIGGMLHRLDALTAWADDIRAYALQQAINGREFAGWKLVEGRANRKYTDEATVANTVIAAGFEPYEHKLLGITAMQKLLGKARFDKLLGAYIEKPHGKPTLVPESDPREALSTAKNDFMEVKL